MSRRAVRILRFIMLAAVAVELLYIVAGNILLRAGAFQAAVNSDPLWIYIHFDEAWTIIPGRIHFRNFELRHQDNNVQSLLHIDEGTIQIELLPLLRKRFHASSVSGVGTSFRFRHKFPKEALVGMLDRAALYPPIHGFSDPPLRGFPWPPSDPNRLWTIELDGVDARLDELWFQEFRYAGDGRVRGGFRLMPAQRVWVGPVDLELGPGMLAAGTVVAIDVRAALTVKVDDFDVNALEGWDVFREISVRGHLGGALAGLDVADLYLPPGAWLRGGAGRFAAGGTLDHGRFLAATRIDYLTDGARLVTERWEVRGGAALSAVVDESGAGARFTSPRMEIAGQHGVRPAVLTRPAVTVASTSAVIGESWRVDGADIDLPAFAAPDLALANALTAPADVVVKKGALAGSGRAKIDRDDHLTGTMQATVRDAEVVVNRLVTLTGNGTVAGNLSQAAAGRGPGAIDDVEIAIDPLVITVGKAGSGAGSLGIGKGALLFRDLSASGVRGRIALQFPSAKSIIDAVGAKTDAIPGLAKALVSNDNLRAWLWLRVEPSVTDVQILTARTDNASARGRFRRVGDRKRGAFLVKTKVGNAGVAIDDDGAHVKLLAGEGWFTENLTRLGLLDGS